MTNCHTVSCLCDSLTEKFTWISECFVIEYVHLFLMGAAFKVIWTPEVYAIPGDNVMQQNLRMIHGINNS